MASTVLAVALGGRISKLRAERGWSQSELARRTGLSSRSVISYYELGERFPSYETLVRMADVFGVTTDYLLRGINTTVPCTSPAELSTQEETGDTYIHIRAGTLPNSQIDALMTLIEGLQQDKN